METTFLNWLVADVLVLGLRAQNWMLLIALFFVLYGCVHLLKRERRHG